VIEMMTDVVGARMLFQMHILAKEEDIKIPSRDEKAHQYNISHYTSS